MDSRRRSHFWQCVGRASRCNWAGCAGTSDSDHYQLGPLGFLYDDDDKQIEANLGLLDQQLALQWIHSNIGHFGGNPDKITLFGNSAGGASASLLLYSEKSHKLIQNAIFQSGVFCAPWASDTKERAAEKFDLFTRLLNCKMATGEQTVSCLRNQSVSSLLTAVQEMPKHITFKALEFPFVPVLKRGTNQKLMTDLELNRLEEFDFKKPHSSIILGYTKNEGTGLLQSILPDKCTLENACSAIQSEKEFRNAANLLLQGRVDENRIGAVIDYYRSLIDHSITASNRYLRPLENIASEYHNICATLHFAERILDDNKQLDVYLYEYDHSSSWQPKWIGATHGSEIEFVFGKPIVDNNGRYSDREQQLSAYLIELWSSFAREGTPKLKNGSLIWPKYEKHSRNYLKINQSGLSIQKTPEKLSRCSKLYPNDYSTAANIKIEL